LQLLPEVGCFPLIWWCPAGRLFIRTCYYVRREDPNTKTTSVTWRLQLPEVCS
jgi:hypothetical protein